MGRSLQWTRVCIDDSASDSDATPHPHSSSTNAATRTMALPFMRSASNDSDDEESARATSAAPARQHRRRGVKRERTWRCTVASLSPREWMQRALLVLLLAVCLFGDLFAYQQVLFRDWSLLRHLVDSATHAGVGFCVWGVFLCFSHDARIPGVDDDDATGNGNTTPLPVLSESVGRASAISAAHRPTWREWRAFLLSCFIAGVTAALLDVDHFIAAGALSIAGATHLRGRPFGHAVTFIVAVALAVWAYSKYRDGASRWRRIHRVSFVLATLLSHQLRDAQRLGLWFWPIGSTPPIFYLVYLLMEAALPIALAKWQVTEGTRDGDDHERDGDSDSDDDNDNKAQGGLDLEAPRTRRQDDDNGVGVALREEHRTPAPHEITL